MNSELHSSLFRNCTHPEFGIALAGVKEMYSCFKISELHSFYFLKNQQIVDKYRVL